MWRNFGKSGHTELQEDHGGVEAKQDEDIFAAINLMFDRRKILFAL